MIRSKHSTQSTLAKMFTTFILLTAPLSVTGFSTGTSPLFSARQRVTPAPSPLWFSDVSSVTPGHESSRRKMHERRKKEWIDRSVNYYSKVMREERRRNMGQLQDTDESLVKEEDYVILAKKHYFALYKIKTGHLHHAEQIYRKIIDELSNEEDGHCDHAKLAVTTLLLALLKQRMGDRKGTRSVFLNFFRTAVIENEGETECACSAKVLQAYALFEMKQGHRFKSLEIADKAIEFDQTLAPVLQWKQFRDARRTKKNERQKKDWINQSVKYYSKVMREERRRSLGRAQNTRVSRREEEYVDLAKKHYFALRKIKSGKLRHAEGIYGKIIDELSQDKDCDQAKIAVTTLLLALLKQRMGDMKGTRSVFLNFFRMAVVENEGETECACSAKVLQAYALFEMKQGNALKSLEIANKAIEFDQTLAPVLQRKLFREAQERSPKSQTLLP